MGKWITESKFAENYIIEFLDDGKLIWDGQMLEYELLDDGRLHISGGIFGTDNGSVVYYTVEQQFDDEILILHETEKSSDLMWVGKRVR